MINDNYISLGVECSVNTPGATNVVHACLERKAHSHAIFL